MLFKIDNYRDYYLSSRGAERRRISGTSTLCCAMLSRSFTALRSVLDDIKGETVVKSYYQFANCMSSNWWMNSRPRSVHTR